MSEFNREERYIVVKLSDLKYETAVRAAHKFLKDHSIPTRECVVVEPDWPIYELVWDMVQRLAESRPQQVDELRSNVLKQANDLSAALLANKRQAEAIDLLRTQLQSAIWRLDDMLMGDDGQAWKEARKARPAMQAALDATKPQEAKS